MAKFFLSVIKKDDEKYTGKLQINPGDNAETFPAVVSKDKSQYVTTGKMNVAVLVNGKWTTVGSVSDIKFKSEETREKAMTLDSNGKSHAPCKNGLLDLSGLVPGAFKGEVVVFLGEHTFSDGKKLTLSFSEARQREVAAVSPGGSGDPF